LSDALNVELARAARLRHGQQLLALGVFAMSLLATVTNLVPLSLFYIVLVPLAVYGLIRNRALPRSVVALLVMYAGFLVSVLVYAPSSLLDPSFYRRDGNVFVTFLPVIICGALRLHVDADHLLRGFLRWVTVINAAFICIFIATGGTIFLVQPGTYHFLFVAHNAAGGYLATVTAFAIGNFIARGRAVLPLTMVLINAVGLVLTVSRGSLLGLGLAIVLVLMLRERFVKTTLLATVLVFAGLLSYTYPVWVATGEPTGFWESNTPLARQADIEAEEANVLDRALFLWPRALDLFLKSPIVGTGFGSYNDVPYNLVGIPHVVEINRPTELIFSAAHAHNTYLHVLAETGLVGLALLAFVLRQIWRDIDSLEPSAVRLALKLGYWVAIFASLTEHRLFTPSQMLPFTILLGVGLARRRWGTQAAAQEEGGTPAGTCVSP
jgi:O-antigen ligase